MAEAVEIPLREIFCMISSAQLPTASAVSRAKRQLIRGNALPILLIRGHGYYVAFESGYAPLMAAHQLRRRTIKAIITTRKGP